MPIGKFGKVTEMLTVLSLSGGIIGNVDFLIFPYFKIIKKFFFYSRGLLEICIGSCSIQPQRSTYSQTTEMENIHFPIIGLIFI